MLHPSASYPRGRGVPARSVLPRGLERDTFSVGTGITATGGKEPLYHQSSEGCLACQRLPMGACEPFYSLSDLRRVATGCARLAPQVLHPVGLARAPSGG